MNVTELLTADGYVKGVVLDCTPIELLILNSALRVYVENNRVHPIDRNIAKEMLNDIKGAEDADSD